LAQPVERAIGLDLDRRRIGTRVVKANDLDESPIAGKFRVGYDHAIARLFLFAHTS
jgi:hypothetical protein